MEKKQTRPPVYKRFSDINLDMYVHGEERENKLLRGRGILNPQKAEFTFLENKPNEVRSSEVERTLHARCIRRPNGGYTLTFRFHPAERALREQLLSELRTVYDAVKKDDELVRIEAKLATQNKQN